jgi:DNA-directed RNA polymerase specialized sigma24 family protein
MLVDRDLVLAARAGDQEAFADLIRTRADRLFAVAYRILRDSARAEDAVQDALVLAWRDLKGSAIRSGSMPGCTGSWSTSARPRHHASVIA